MISTIASVICFSIVNCQKITHELPRLKPFHHHHPLYNPPSPYHGYTSPLRPGYQWPIPQYKYAPLTHHKHQIYHHYQPHHITPHVSIPNTTFNLEDDQVLDNLERPARGEAVYESEDEEQTYNFGYAVNDIKHGDDFSHQVSNDGLHTNGEYRVALPDGRVQVIMA